jgi:hypothetical protein
MGGAHRATAIGFVSAFSRLPVHPVNTKANNRAMILIRAIPFCQVSKQERSAIRTRHLAAPVSPFLVKKSGELPGAKSLAAFGDRATKLVG